MFILDLVSNCNNPALANLFMIARKFITILQILVPIIAIVFLAVNVVKSVKDPEDKKNFGRYKNWLLALVMVFAVPVIVDTVMNLLGENYSISACWNYAEQVQSMGQNSSYNDGNDKDKESILVDPGKYDDGSSNKNNGGNTSSNTGSNNSNTTNVGDGKVIFIGDSRTVQMKAHVGSSGDVWSCKGSMGLKWMSETGVPNIQGYIKNGSKIVILMGVNDLYQPDNYIKYINGKVSEWTGLGADIYFVSVNPCDGSYSHLNEKITSFNNKLRSGLNSRVKYLDCNSHLKSVGFTTTDGLHYDSSTSRKIYNFIKSNI